MDKEELKASPFISALITEMGKQNWIMHRQGGEDTGRRELYVSNNAVEIKWSSWHNRSENVHGQVSYSFAKSGYAPLRSYDYDKMELIAEAITQGIKSIVPGARFERDGLVKRSIYSEYSEKWTYFVPFPTRSLF